MRSAFGTKLDQLDSDSRRLHRSNSAARRSLSVIAPTRLCLECGGRLIQRNIQVFYQHDVEEGAAVSVRTDEMVGTYYFSCDDCGQNFAHASQFTPEFRRAVENSLYMLVTGDGGFISMVLGRPFK